VRRLGHELIDLSADLIPTTVNQAVRVPDAAVRGRSLCA